MADRILQNSNGGQFCAAVSAGTPGAGAVLTGAGRLCKVIMTAQGSASMGFYDAASATGTPIFVIPASGTATVTAGTVYDLQIPVTTGIYAGGAANTSQVTVTYSKDGQNGNA